MGPTKDSRQMFKNMLQHVVKSRAGAKLLNKNIHNSWFFAHLPIVGRMSEVALVGRNCSIKTFTTFHNSDALFAHLVLLVSAKCYSQNVNKIKCEKFDEF